MPTINCPSCRELIRLPEDRETTACPNCGKKLRIQAMEDATPDYELAAAPTKKRKKKNSAGWRVLITIAVAQALWHILCVIAIAGSSNNIRYEGQQQAIQAATLAMLIYVPLTIIGLILLFMKQPWARYLLSALAVLGFFTGIIVAGRGLVNLSSSEGLAWILEGTVRAAFNAWMAHLLIQSEPLIKWLKS